MPDPDTRLSQSPECSSNHLQQMVADTARTHMYIHTYIHIYVLTNYKRVYIHTCISGLKLTDCNLCNTYCLYKYAILASSVGPEYYYT